MDEGDKDKKYITPEEARKKLGEINLPSPAETIVKGGELYKISNRIKNGIIEENDTQFLIDTFNLFNNLGRHRLLVQISAESPNKGESATAIEEIAEEAQIDFDKGSKDADSLVKYVGALMYAEPGYGCKTAIDALITVLQKSVKTS